MNDAHDEVAERRLDWGLAENEGGSAPPDLVAKVLARAAAAERSEARRPARARVWLTAATVLLALFAVVGVRMLAREPAAPPADAPAQDPEAVHVRSLDDVASIARDTKTVLVRNQGDDILQAIADRCRHLESLSISALGAPAAASPTDRAFSILAGSTKLRALQFFKTPGVTGSQLHELERLPVLEELRLNLLNLDAKGLEALPRFPSLRVLDLTGTQGLLLSHLEVIAKCQSLRQLGLSHCRDLSSDAVSPIRALTGLEKLEIRHLRGRLDGIGLDRLTRLRVLDLDKTEFSPDVLARLPQSITELHVGGASLDDAGCAILRDRLPNLRELSVQNTNVGHDGLAALLAIPALESLDLTFTVFLDSPRGDLERTVGQLAASPTLRVVTLSPAPYLAKPAERLFAAGIDVRLGSTPRDDLETTLAALRERHADAIAARAARTTRTPR